MLNMLKVSLVSEINFPENRKNTEFNVRGDKKQDVFVISIFRGNINRLKYNIGARIEKNGIMLLELHINPSYVHRNPDGEKISGSHWHIYNEEYGLGWAFPAEDVNGEQFVANTIAFLDKFKVIEKPTINVQLELM